MVRTMCGVMLVNNRNAEELIDLLELKEAAGKGEWCEVVWSCFETT